MEVWKPIGGWEGMFEVSNLGNVRNVPRTITRRTRGAFVSTQKIMAFRREKSGYLSISFRRPLESKSYRYKVHRLVLLAFVGPCPEGHQCAHNNGIKTDNRLENLRWSTPTENHADKLRHGTTSQGRKSSQAVLTDERVTEIRTSVKPDSFFAREFGVSPGIINRARTGKTWRHVETPPQPVGQSRARYQSRTSYEGYNR